MVHTTWCLDSIDINQPKDEELMRALPAKHAHWYGRSRRQLPAVIEIPSTDSSSNIMTTGEVLPVEHSALPTQQ